MATSNSQDGRTTWAMMPNKRQLALLVLARLSEPLTMTSMQSYVFYQLKSFDDTLPDSTIATQIGVLTASFTAAQFFTAMLWARWSDDVRIGRKNIILLGLLGSVLCSIGYGMATNFATVVFYRVLAGALNGNVGVMKAMLAEVVEEKRFLSRAFLLFPMCFNIGVVVGPMLGGLLADPARNYPTTLGSSHWLQMYPYLAPNLVVALYLGIMTVLVFLMLKETLPGLRHEEDIGRKTWLRLKSLLQGSRPNYAYTPLASGDVHLELAAQTSTPASDMAKPPPQRPISLRQMMTRNLAYTLISYALLGATASTFNALWPTLLSTPVFDPAHPYPAGHQQRLPIHITGGLGLPPHDIGLVMSIMGTLGILTQVFIYPSVSDRLGALRSFRLALWCFPVVYALTPYLPLVPSTTLAPAPRTGAALWAAMSALLLVQVVGRTFALPASNVLINNACPHPSVLGTTHGLALCLISAGRTVVPVLASCLYGLGLEVGVVGMSWWCLGVLAIGTVVVSRFVRDGLEEGEEQGEAEGERNLDDRPR